MFRLITNTLLASAVLVTASATMDAQVPQVNAYFGLGTATDSSNGQQIDTFGDGNFYNTPKITGLFATVGANVMLTPHYGVGGEFNWRTSQGDYAGLNYRPLIYDFNGIWQPLGNKSKRFVPELQAGLGGVDVRYYYNSRACDQFVGCTNASQFIEGANHFQLHLSAAVRMYVTPHIFLRPAVDAHWVNNFSQFGSNWMPEYSLGVGYSFGGE